jgi:hypothetical protein
MGLRVPPDAASPVSIGQRADVEHFVDDNADDAVAAAVPDEQNRTVG